MKAVFTVIMNKSERYSNYKVYKDGFHEDSTQTLIGAKYCVWRAIRRLKKHPERKEVYRKVVEY